MNNLKIAKAFFLRQYFAEQFIQGRYVPLPIAEIENELPDGLFGGDRKVS